MKSIFFISDIHLGAASEEIERKKTEQLLAFLDHTKEQAGVLYILGDLYDFWFEYGNAIPKIDMRVLAKLGELVEHGVAVHYLLGNHDCWHERYFVEQTGVKMHREPQIISHHSLKLFLAHGDGLIRKDWPAKLRSRIFKSKMNILLYRLLPPDLGIPFGQWVAAKSREKGENRFAAEYRAFAQEKLSNGFDAVILGHTHKLLFEKTGAKYYINLGEFGNHFKYLKLKDGDFEIQTLPATSSKVTNRGNLPQSQKYNF